MREGMARGRMTERAKELADIQKWFDGQLYAARGSEELRNEIIAVAREKRDEINAKYDKLDAEKAKAAAEKKKADDEKALQEAIRLREKEDHYTIEAIKAKDDIRVSSTAKAIELQTTLTDVTLSEEAKRLAAERKAEEDRKNVYAAAWDARYELASAATKSMMALNDALTQSGIISAEKGFKIGKALSIAQTTISTIEGVQNALNAASTLPEPFGMALKVANAVTIGAAGAASIAKIAATQFEGGTTPPGTINMPSPSGGAMGGGGGQAPAALNLSGLQGNISNAPLQTYVLAGQVSNAQQAEFKIKNTASILGGG
jgi:hypothetical protein